MASTEQPDGADAPALDGLADAVAHTAAAVTDLKALPDTLAFTVADDLLDATVALDAHITRLHALRARLLRRVDVTEAYRARGYVTTASWWRDATRRDHSAASRHVRTARRLDDLPTLAAALDDAAITLDHADTITRAAKPGRAEAIYDADDILTELARRARRQELRVACRRIADLVDPDGTPPPDTTTDARDDGGDDGGDDDTTAADENANTHENDDATDATATPGGDSDADAGDADPQPSGEQVALDPERGLWLHRSYDGRWRLTAELDNVTGQRAFTLLEHLDTRDDPDTAPTQRRSPAQRRHDAFAQLLKAAEELPDLPTRHGARPHVLLTIDLLSLLGHDACATRRPRLASGGELARDTAIELLHDATLTPILQLGPYRSVAVGRTHRTLPTWLRPLLTITHRTCRGPGCDRPIPWTQAAHLDDWNGGGDTDLDRTLPACGPHHRLRDHDSWHVHFDPDTGHVTWTRPDGNYRITTDPPDP